jgi:hypothetical protein
VTDITIEQRLAAWGEALEFPGGDALADDVLAAIGGRPRRSLAWRVALAAAAALVLVAVAVVAIPDGRHAVARWLGLARLEVRVVDEPATAPGTGLGPRFTLDGAATAVGVAPYVAPVLGEPVAVHAPGGHYVAVRYDDGGTSVLVVTLPGRLFHKEVASGSQAEPLDVHGADGLWVTGSPHELVYEEPAGGVVQSRASADTLVWQAGDVIVRIEGDIGRARALELAAGVTRTGTGTSGGGD